MHMFFIQICHRNRDGDGNEDGDQCDGEEGGGGGKEGGGIGGGGKEKRHNDKERLNNMMILKHNQHLKTPNKRQHLRFLSVVLGPLAPCYPPSAVS